MTADSQLVRSGVTLLVNGRKVVLEAAPDERLLDALRRAGFKEVKEGCGEGECGSCTVLLDGRAVCSCLTLAHSVDGSEVITAAFEGDPILEALRRAFAAEHATQCGFCTPGALLAAAELLAETRRVDDDRVREALAGNLCRCTGYASMVRAVRRAARALDREA